MNVIDVTSRHQRAPETAMSGPSHPGDGSAWRKEIVRVLITFTTAVVAGVLGWLMWGAYVGSPWTRDATVRAYVVNIAPQVAGNIVELRVTDNKLVSKGELLMVVDPIDYAIAVSQAEAAVQQAQASIQGFDAQIAAQNAQIAALQAQRDREQSALVFAQQQETRYGTLAKDGYGSVQNAQKYSSQLHQQEAALQMAEQSLHQARLQVAFLKAQRTGADATLLHANAQLRQARVNLDRTRVVSPVDGYVTNLLAQQGDYVNIGANTIAVVDANSFWVDGYFEETNLSSIREGDAARIKLMGRGVVLHGHVASTTRAINVPNAQPNSQGLATVNPIFTWVRLAQRIPVRILVDEVPAGFMLAAGMTATVEIEHRKQPAGK